MAEQSNIVSLLMLVENRKEQEILKMFLEQSDFKVIVSQPTYANYLRVLQYSPSVILLEMPENYANQVGFAGMVRKNRKTSMIPIMAYGSHTDDLVIKGFKDNGASLYIPRPLKTRRILEAANGLLQRRGKPVAGPQAPEPKEAEDDPKRLLDPQWPVSEKMSFMIESVKTMLAFPFTVAKVLKITQSEDSGASDLAKAIQADPVAATTILKVANSVLFASRGKRIADIKEAIVRIGFRETKNISMSLTVMKIVGNRQKNVGFNRVEFWYHSLSSAIIAEKLAKHAGYPHPEEAFISGLLHDFGIIVLDELFSEVFEHVLAQATKHASSFACEEKKVFGFDHYELSEQLFKAWNLPDSVVFAVRNQTRYHALPETTEPNLSLLATAVGVAHTIVKAAQIGHECDMYVEPIANRFFESLKRPSGLDNDFWNQVYDELNMFNRFLEIDEREFPTNVETLEDASETKIAVVRRDSSVFSAPETYLRMQRYPMVPAKSPETIQQMEPGARMVVCLAGKGDTLQQIERYTGIVLKEEGKDLDTKNLKYLPVLVFCDPESDLKNLKGKDGMAFLGNEMDLRQVDLRIESLVRGTTIQELVEVEVTTRQLDGGIRILDLAGSVQVNNLLEMREHLLGATQDDTRYLALNFSKVEFVDSSALRLLVNLQKRMTAKKGKLCLYSVGDGVYNVLDATNLTKIFAIAKDEDSIYETLGIGDSLSQNAEAIAAQQKPPSKYDNEDAAAKGSGEEKEPDADAIFDDVVSNL